MLENLDVRSPTHMQPQLTEMRPKSTDHWTSRPPAPSASIVSDDMRFAIVDAVYLRPGIWDNQRDKNGGHSRKALFAEITQIVNQQNTAHEPMTCEEVEKQWKNLKDTYNKTRKKVTFDNEGCVIPPKWKFYSSMMFLDEVAPMNHNPGSSRMQIRGRSEENGGPPMKKSRDVEDEDDDEYMGFCRSLVYPLRDIGYRDKVAWLKLQKTIRDLIYDTQISLVTGQPLPPPHIIRNDYK